MTDIVKTISFDLWHKDPELFANQLGENQKLTGFCGIKDHPIAKELVDDCINMFADFFHQNNQIKMQYFDKIWVELEVTLPIKQKRQRMEIMRI